MEGLSRRGGLVDLAIRIGAAAGMSGYRVDQNDHIGFDCLLRRQGQDGMLPITAPKLPAEYERGQSDPRGLALVLLPPCFDAQALREAGIVEQWEPDERIVLRSPCRDHVPLAAWSRSEAAVLAIGALILFLSQWEPTEGWGSLQMLEITAGAACVAWVVLKRIDARLRTAPIVVILDWALASIEIHSSPGVEEVRFSELLAVETHPTNGYDGPGAGGGLLGSGYRLCLVVGGGSSPPRSRPVLSFRAPHALTPYRLVMPLGRELARLLSVPHRDPNL